MTGGVAFSWEMVPMQEELLLLRLHRKASTIMTNFRDKMFTPPVSNHPQCLYNMRRHPFPCPSMGIVAGKPRIFPSWHQHPRICKSIAD